MLQWKQQVNAGNRRKKYLVLSELQQWECLWTGTAFEEIGRADMRPAFFTACNFILRSTQSRAIRQKTKLLLRKTL